MHEIFKQIGLQQQMQDGEQPSVGNEEKYVTKKSAELMNSIVISDINTLFNKFLNQKALGMGKDKVGDFIGYIKKDIEKKFNEKFSDEKYADGIPPEELKAFVQESFAPLKNIDKFKTYIFQCASGHGEGVDLVKLQGDLVDPKSNLNKILPKFYSDDGESKYTVKLDKILGEELDAKLTKYTLTRTQPVTDISEEEEANLDISEEGEANLATAAAEKKRKAEEELQKEQDAANKELQKSKDEKKGGFFGILIGILQNFLPEDSPIFKMLRSISGFFDKKEEEKGDNNKTEAEKTTTTTQPEQPQTPPQNNQKTSADVSQQSANLAATNNTLDPVEAARKAAQEMVANGLLSGMTYLKQPSEEGLDYNNNYGSNGRSRSNSNGVY